MTLVADFHDKFGSGNPGAPAFISHDEIRFRMRLLREEYEETRKELLGLLDAKNPDEYMDGLRRLLKELADLRYVLDGCAVTLGLDIEGAFEEVHRSNMTKVPDPAGGKAVKGPCYREADMVRFVPPILDVDHEEIQCPSPE